MNETELLQRVSLFSGLKEKYLRSLLESCIKRRFLRGEALVRQGEPGRGLYVLLSGRVKVVKEIADGEELQVAALGPGDFFGEMAVLDGAPRSASVIASEDTEVLVLTLWEFKAKMKTHPEIALSILPVVVKRFRETNEQLLTLARL